MLCPRTVAVPWQRGRVQPLRLLQVTRGRHDQAAEPWSSDVGETPWCVEAERLASHAPSASLTKTVVFTQSTLVRPDPGRLGANEAAVDASMPFQSPWTSPVLLEKRQRPVDRSSKRCWSASDDALGRFHRVCGHPPWRKRELTYPDCTLQLIYSEV
jgi:hypothetical protein